MVDCVAHWDDKVQAFRPSTRFDLDACGVIKSRRDGRLSFTFGRSIQLQRWYRGFVARAAEALDISPGIYHAQLKYDYGLIEGVLSSPRFGVAVQLRSTAFKEMDETEFLGFVRFAVEATFRDYLPGVDRGELLKAVEEWVGPCPF